MNEILTLILEIQTNFIITQKMCSIALKALDEIAQANPSEEITIILYRATIELNLIAKEMQNETPQQTNRH